LEEPSYPARMIVVVALRPLASLFLSLLAIHCELVVWTAGTQSYDRAVLTALNPSGSLISHSLFRQHYTEDRCHRSEYVRLSPDDWDPWQTHSLRPQYSVDGTGCMRWKNPKGSMPSKQPDRMTVYQRSTRPAGMNQGLIDVKEERGLLRLTEWGKREQNHIHYCQRKSFLVRCLFVVPLTTDNYRQQWIFVLVHCDINWITTGLRNDHRISRNQQEIIAACRIYETTNLLYIGLTVHAVYEWLNWPPASIMHRSVYFFFDQVRVRT